MLVLTRRPGESIMISDDVVVTVLEIRGEVVRLGIKAPRTVPVHREEVYLELRAANEAAASPAETDVQALADLVLADLLAPPADGPGGAGGHRHGGAARDDRAAPDDLPTSRPVAGRPTPP